MTFMTVKEFMQKYEVSKRTVYRWIEDEKLSAGKSHGQWVIDDDKEPRNDIGNDKIDDKSDKKYDNDDIGDVTERQEILLIQEMRDEIEYLRKELTQAHEALTLSNQTIAEMQQRHDIIVLQLTTQNQQLLEDTRNRSVWTRVKIALGFVSS